MRTAIIHYWIVAERGGEKVLRALCDLFPDAVIFTHVVDRDLASKLYPGHEIRTTFINRLPLSRTKYQSYLPLMPLALEEIDLSGFDLIISSESGPAKGVVAPPGATHVCYCHSPMRYIWDHYHLYRKSAGLLARMVMPFVAHRLRQWDVTSAARVDHFIANSGFVASRIKKYYRRDARVIHPPVDVGRIMSSEAPRNDRFEGAYLWVGQLTVYKDPQAAIAAAQRLNRKLVVIGDGDQAPALRAHQHENIQFLGRVDDATLMAAYASCRALLFPGEEDFGMTPVEAMAAGTPVIALNRGGARETVVHKKTGLLYDNDTQDALADAIVAFEAIESNFDPDDIRKHAKQFSYGAFKNNLTNFFRQVGVEITSSGEE